jgi:hypothetical protein
LPAPDLPVPADTPAVPDLPAPADTAPGIDGTPTVGCAPQTVDLWMMPVRGTVRGPTVEGEVCDNGMGTYFLGPEDTEDHRERRKRYAQLVPTNVEIGPGQHVR